MSSETGQEAPGMLRRRAFISLPLVLFAALAVVFLIRLNAGDPSKLPSALIGKPVPKFDLTPVEGLMSDGKPVEGLSAKALTGSKVSVVNFWASWCPPCRVEHPFLMDLGKRDDIHVYGINQKDKPGNARRFLGHYGNPYIKVGADPKGRVSIDWGVYGLPETFVVDGQGIIRYKHVGPITADTLERLLPAIEEAKQPLATN
ncbi:MAG: DsbE family thiol:disulfide interchange protein [Hyphomicrobiales bacterium]